MEREVNIVKKKGDTVKDSLDNVNTNAAINGKDQGDIYTINNGTGHGDMYIINNGTGHGDMYIINNGTNHGGMYTINNSTQSSTAHANPGETKVWTVNWYVVTFIIIVLMTFVIFSVVRRHWQKREEFRKEAEYLSYYHSILPHSKIYCRSSYDASRDNMIKSVFAERRNDVFSGLEKLSVFFQGFTGQGEKLAQSYQDAEPSTNIELPTISEDFYETKEEGNEDDLFTISKHAEMSTAAPAYHPNEISGNCDSKHAEMSTAAPAYHPNEISGNCDRKHAEMSTAAPAYHPNEISGNCDRKQTYASLEDGHTQIQIRFNNEENINKLLTDSQQVDTWL